MTNSTKLKLYSCAVKAKSALDKACVVGGTAFAGVMATGITSSAETSTASAPTIDLSGVDFSGLTTSITSMVPQVLPVAVTICGIRKAISFLMSTIRGC
jgi:hypothetical protein